LNALYSNTTGYNNSAQGHQAGIYIADGTTANATSGTSLYLGADTKALADGGANEIVIGYNAIGVGSNSVVLGNDSITKTILKGNVGLGTTTPNYKLDIGAAAASDSSFALSDLDVVHGLTTLATTSTYGLFNPISSTAGGVKLTALSDTDAQAFLLRGVMGSTDPTDATSAIKLVGAKSNGTTGMADLGAAETVFQVANNDDAAAMTVLGNSFIGIGNTAPAIRLHVGSASITDATNLIRLQDADSTCDFNANAGSPSCGSDLTLKKDIYALDTGDLLTKIANLRPVSYKWNTDSDNSGAKYGFIAQEVGEQFPDLVSDGTWVDGSVRKFLNIGGLVPYIVGAVKQQQAQIADLKSTDLQVVNGKLTTLEQQVAQLMANSAQTQSPAAPVVTPSPSPAPSATPTPEPTPVSTASAALADLMSPFTGTASASLTADATRSAQLLRASFNDIQMTEDDVTLLTSATFVEKYLDVTGSAFIGGYLGVEKGLIIGNGLTLTANENGALDIFNGRLTIADTGLVSISGDLEIGGRLTLADKDAGGFAKIKVGDSQVRVQFDTSYAEKPVVTVTADSALAQYGVIERDQTGFTIYLAQPAVAEENFSWTALAVKEAKMVESGVPVGPDLPPIASESGEVAGVATSSAEVESSTQSASLP